MEPFDYTPHSSSSWREITSPVIRGGDEGIWRRIDMVPFEVTIPKEQRDVGLAEKLRAELPGILNWAVAGCLQWQKRGLDSPSAVVSAVAEYKEDMDILGQWVAEKCEIGPELNVAVSDAYCSYKFWAESSGVRAWSLPIFGRKLKERFVSKRASGCVQYFGFRVKVYMPAAGISGVPRAKLVPTMPLKPV